VALRFHPRTLHILMRAKTLLCVASFLALPSSALAAVPQTFTPLVSFSVHDEPVDGLGDSFNGSPFEGMIRTQSSRADRAMQEFDVSSLAGQPIMGATLSGRVSVNNAFDNGVRTFDFSLYDANGVADLSDYQITATVVGSGQYHPPINTFFDYSFNVTAEVQALVQSGATHIGLRVEGTSNPNFPNILSDTASQLVIGSLPTVGTSYCGGGPPNSTGVPGVILALGSATAAANDVTLSASALPANAFGFFIASRMQGLVAMPGGSQGNLCLGGAIGRYVGAGQIKNSGQTGTISLVLDLTQTPTPTGFVVVAAGETWNYQAWHRDSVGGMATSNFTNGVSVDFQ